MLNPLSQDKWSLDHASHLLNRAGFGGSPEEVESLYQLGKDEGIAAAVDSFANPTETWADNPFPDWAQDESDLNGDLYDNAGNRRREFNRWYYKDLLYGQPLSAKLLKFYIDHFPIEWGTITQYTRFIYFFRYFNMMRKHAAGDVEGDGRFGNFKTLVNDVSWSEGMMRTLDLYTSTRNRINENFGRELLELFTLGVDGGYTEDDVGTAASAFTGRKLYNYQSPHPNAPTFRENTLAPPGVPQASSYLREDLQDLEPKSFLGFSKMPDGRDIVTGDDILELVFANIQCSYHLSWKLWRYFVAPNPDEQLLQALALRFRDTHNYEVRPFLRDIFLSEDFYAKDARGRQVKDGPDFLVGIFKLLQADLPSGQVMEILSDRIGYSVMFPPNISGWAEPEGRGNKWLSAGSMVFRLNVPSLLVQGNADILANFRARREFADYELPDWDRIAPTELRPLHRFPELIARLNRFFLPLKPLRGNQVRTLYGHYQSVCEKRNELEGVKELIRLIMALPEFQLQ